MIHTLTISQEVIDNTFAAAGLESAIRNIVYADPA